MSSRSSSSSRKTVVHVPRNDNCDFPDTPTKTTAGARLITPENEETTTMPTLLKRRGRLQAANGTFRPLSIFTNSMLLPFDHNFDKAFDVLKSDSPDRVKIAKSLLSTDTQGCLTQGHGGKTAADNSTSPSLSQSQDVSQGIEACDNQGDSLENEKVAIPQRRTPKFNMALQSSSEDSDMDLMTALKTTSPEKDSCDRISADFQTLCEIPMPDPSDHPAFAPNPFEVKTGAPLLFTSTSAEEIRAYRIRQQRLSDKSSSIGRQSVDRKKSLFGLGLATPSSIISRNAFSSSEEYHLPTLPPTPPFQYARSSTKGTSPVTTDFATSKDSTNTDRSSGVRKFSDLFKRKDSLEKSDPQSPVWSPRLPADSPLFDRQELETTLRRSTYTPTFDFDPYSPYPRHPNTGRGWKSRNLKCTTCLGVDCAVCRRVCCAYRAAVLALDNHGDDSPGRPLALQRIHDITRLYPYGKEIPTFLQCTKGPGGDTVGCGKMICPDCCSICPDEACADTVCRRCKPAMWEDCDWHSNGKLFAEEYTKGNDDV